MVGFWCSQKDATAKRVHRGRKLSGLPHLKLFGFMYVALDATTYLHQRSLRVCHLGMDLRPDYATFALTLLASTGIFATSNVLRFTGPQI